MEFTTQNSSCRYIYSFLQVLLQRASSVPQNWDPKMAMQNVGGAILGSLHILWQQRTLQAHLDKQHFLIVFHISMLPFILISLSNINLTHLWASHRSCRQPHYSASSLFPCCHSSSFPLASSPTCRQTGSNKPGGSWCLRAPQTHIIRDLHLPLLLSSTTFLAGQLQDQQALLYSHNLVAF